MVFTEPGYEEARGYGVIGGLNCAVCPRTVEQNMLSSCLQSQAFASLGDFF